MPNTVTSSGGAVCARHALGAATVCSSTEQFVQGHLGRGTCVGTCMRLDLIVSLVSLALDCVRSEPDALCGYVVSIRWSNDWYDGLVLRCVNAMPCPLSCQGLAVGLHMFAR